MASICVVGLGKLGSVLGAVLAREGHDVVGVDVSQFTVDTINRGFAPVEEPGLAELMKGVKSLHHFEATTEYGRAVGKTDMAFIVVPTPSNPDGAFDNSYVVTAVQGICSYLLSFPKPYTIAVVSTVMPGSMDGEIKQAAASLVSLVYCPAFIALGSVIHNLTHPDMLLIGSDDPKSEATRKVARVLAELCYDTAPAHHMSLLEAEIAKLALNVSLSIKINLANEIGMLCEAAGADATKVLKAVGADSRIGNKLLTPGGPPGGVCLPRDLVAFDRYADRLGTSSFLPSAASKVTTALIKNIISQLFVGQSIERDITIGVLGLAYKPNTAITTESIGSHVVAALREPRLFGEVTVIAHDQMVDPSSVEVDMLDEAQDVVDKSDVVLIATAWPEYKDLYYGDSKVIDLWGVVPKGENVHRFGVGHG